MPTLPGRAMPRAIRCLDAGADVVLLGAAPVGLLDRLAEGQAEAGRAAIVGRRARRSPARRGTGPGADAVLGVRGRAAMHVHDQAARGQPGAVEPALDLQPVGRFPAHVFRRDEIGRAQRRDVPQPRQGEGRRRCGRPAPGRAAAARCRSCRPIHRRSRRAAGTRRATSRCRCRRRDRDRSATPCCARASISTATMLSTPRGA